MLTVTDAAIDKFKEILKEKEMEEGYIQLYVSGFG